MSLEILFDSDRTRIEGGIRVDRNMGILDVQYVH